MKQMAIISGKGGTGKTSILLAFSRMAKGAVLADCDVDASNLPVTLAPTPQYSHDVRGAYKACIDPELCTSCGLYRDHCRFGAITEAYSVMPLRCEGCGVCEYICPAAAISLNPVISGTLHVADTPDGPLVYMDMIPGEEGTGKLVTAVRNKAKEVAEAQNARCVLIDGSPGIGCPVIATIGAVDLALIVTEPSLSGYSDLVRVAELCASMDIPCAVCVNKYDVNHDVAKRISEYCTSASVPVLGQIPYDTRLARSIEMGLPVPVESAGAWNAIERCWTAVCRHADIAQ